jgi:hypothetical protein
MRVLDLSNRRFGRWVVEGREGSTKRGISKWRCRCECGTVRAIPAPDLKYGKSKSCGCWPTGEVVLRFRGGRGFTPILSAPLKIRRTHEPR